MAILNDYMKESLEEESDILHRGNMFRGLVFYIPNVSPGTCNADLDDNLFRKLASIQIRFGGGKVSESLSDDVSHVVVENHDDIDEDIKIIRRKKIEDGQKLFKVVTFSWLQSCMEEGKV